MFLNSTGGFPSLSSIGMCFSTLLRTTLSHSPCSPSSKFYSTINRSNPSPPDVNLLHLLSSRCRNFGDLKALNSQFIVRGLFQDETLVGNFLRLCFHLGAPDLAVLAFSRIENPSLFLQNLVIRCLYDRDLYEDVLCIYRKCQFLGCPSDNFTFPFAIKSCSVLGAAGNGREIHCVVLRNGFQHNVVVLTALVGFYAKTGDIGIARKLHDKIPQPDLVSWNALISGYSSHGLNEEVFEVFQQMRVKGLNPNVSTFASVIRVCSRSADIYNTGRAIHGLVLKRGYLLNVFLGPALISMYGSNGDLPFAKEIFDSIPQKNVTMWNAMISAYTQRQQPYDAIELFQEMLHHHLQPNVVTFVSVIPSFENIQGIEHGQSIHAYVVKLGLQNQLAVDTALLSMYAKLGDLDSAKFLFDQMPHRNILSWNSMISGYARNGHWNESLSAICDMQDAGLNPDAITILSILASCSKLGATLSGKSAHSFCLKRGIDWNINISNALLAFYSDCRKITYCFNVFDRMPTRDVVSWNTLISGCVHNGEDECAVFLLQQMQQEGFDLDLVSLISILPCYNNPGNLVHGMSFHGYTIKLGLAYDVSLANALVSMYMNCGALDEGRLIFENMPNREVISWNALMTGYRCHSLEQEVISLLARMVEEEQKPNLVTLLNVLPVCYNHIQGKSIHSYATRRGMEQETSLFPSLILMYGRFKDIRSCSLLFQMGEKVNISLWNAIIGMHINSQNPEIAFSFFSDLLRTETRPDYVTILSLISACLQLNILNLTNSIMGYVIRKGFDKYVAVSNAFIDLYARCGNISCARKLYDDLLQRNGISWNVMINSYALHGDGETALSLLSQMRNLDLQPDDTTYISILSACSHAGLVEQGWVVFNSMLNQGITPRIEHYACMVDLLCRAGRLLDAYDIVKSLPYKPCILSLLESFLGSCLVHGNVELGEKVGRLAMELDPGNSRPYVILHNIYAAAGRWNEASKVRSEMVLKNLTKVRGFSLVERSSSS